MKKIIYRMPDYKDKQYYHEAESVKELIDKTTKYHNDEYIRWSLENWKESDFDKFKVEIYV